MTASELLEALDKSGSADATIDMGRKWVKHFGDDKPHELIEYFERQGVTEGTIHKAKDLLAGRKKPEDYLGKPPPNGKDADAERLARHIVGGLAQLLEEKRTHASEKQGEAQSAGIGNPTAAKRQLASSSAK